MRGRPLQLLAEITDDRSGVGSVQACWRNAYGRDFECQPLGSVAAIVTAPRYPPRGHGRIRYYLEAGTTRRTGPRAAERPELPHAVVMRRPDARGGVRGGGVTPPLPGPVVSATFLPGSPRRHRCSGRPSSDRLRPGPSRLKAAGAIPAWSVTALIGGERSTEQSYTDSALIGRIGIEGSRPVRGELDRGRERGLAHVPPAIRPLRELAGHSGDAGRESFRFRGRGGP